MTTVEFFDRSPIVNVISSLTTKPDKIIFLGAEKMMQRFAPLYRTFLKKRGLQIQLEYRNIRLDDLDSIIDTLTAIVRQEPDCVFDLTGGKDLALVAMGVVWERFRERGLRLQRFSILDSTVTDCDKNGNTLYRGRPALDVQESILLHGGMVRREDTGVSGQQDWDLTEDFIADVHAMWAICRKDPKGWNSRLNVISSATCRDATYDPLEVILSLSKLRTRAKQVKERLVDLGELLHDLAHKGLITHYRETRQEIFFRYKNAQVKKCLEKAGTALEMEVMVTATELRREDGTPCYHDAMCGVAIDWDGRFHDSNDGGKDTENEIDVLLMQGLIPVYISCKNGQVEEVELYKLDTVARRFGGPLARKALVTSRLNMRESSLAHYRQRARDMGIKLIENACDLEPDAFRQMVRDIMQL